jgi:hypothetical protein
VHDRLPSLGRSVGSSFELEPSATLDGTLEVRLPGLDVILQRVAGLDVDGDFPFLAAFANDRYSSFPLEDVEGVPT